MTYLGNWDVDKHRFGLMPYQQPAPVSSVPVMEYLRRLLKPYADALSALADGLGYVFRAPKRQDFERRRKIRDAKRRARLVTWHKGNKKRLTRREKVARGLRKR